jgi:hypothetical protein
LRYLASQAWDRFGCQIGGQSVAELIARFLFYDVRHATIAGTDQDHRVVVLDEELMRLRLRRGPGPLPTSTQQAGREGNPVPPRDRRPLGRQAWPLARQFSRGAWCVPRRSGLGGRALRAHDGALLSRFQAVNRKGECTPQRLQRLSTKQFDMLTKQASELTTLGQRFADTTADSVTRRQGSKRE